MKIPIITILTIISLVGFLSFTINAGNKIHEGDFEGFAEELEDEIVEQTGSEIKTKILLIGLGFFALILGVFGIKLKFG